jgi:hypothetical protein
MQGQTLTTWSPHDLSAAARVDATAQASLYVVPRRFHMILVWARDTEDLKLEEVQFSFDSRRYRQI